MKCFHFHLVKPFFFFFASFSDLSRPLLMLLRANKRTIMHRNRGGGSRPLGKWIPGLFLLILARTREHWRAFQAAFQRPGSIIRAEQPSEESSAAVCWSSNRCPFLWGRYLTPAFGYLGASAQSYRWVFFVTRSVGRFPAEPERFGPWLRSCSGLLPESI